jgi:transposase-like protein
MENKKQIRHFSEAFKKEKVKQLEQKQVSVLQLSRIYNVSKTAIYKWLKKYSSTYQTAERIVLEKESEGYKIMQMMEQIAKLERKIGQQRLHIDLLEKIIEFGNKEIGEDIKKKYYQEHSNGSGSTEVY